MEESNFNNEIDQKVNSSNTFSIPKTSSETLSHPSVEKINDTQNAEEQNLHEILFKCCEGYEVLLNEIKAIQAVKNQLGTIDAYLPNFDNLEPNVITEKLNAGQTYSQIYGFSEEAMQRFYEIACDLRDSARLQDASNAFYFLTVVQPEILDNWFEYAKCEILNNHCEQAYRLYNDILSSDTENPLIEIEAIEQFSKIHDVEKVKFFASKLQEFIDHHPHHELKEELVDYLHSVAA